MIQCSGSKAKCYAFVVFKQDTSLLLLEVDLADCQIE